MIFFPLGLTPTPSSSTLLLTLSIYIPSPKSTPVVFNGTMGFSSSNLRFVDGCANGESFNLTQLVVTGAGVRREKEGRESSFFIGVISRKGVPCILDRIGVQSFPSTLHSFADVEDSPLLSWIASLTPILLVTGFQLTPSGVVFGPRWNENAEADIGRLDGVEVGGPSFFTANGSPIGRGRGMLASLHCL
jgi:hypothetical protein